MGTAGLLVILGCLLSSLCNCADTGPSITATSRTALASLPLQGTLMFNDITTCGVGSDVNPTGVAYPTAVADIAAIVRTAAASDSGLSVAARGLGHNIRGRSQAHNAIVMEMTSLKGIRVVPLGDAASQGVPFVETAGGELWVDVLKASLEYGLAPRSWTDYLYLTVGGTLSNAGISGQTFRHGPEVSNVLQLEVVTGKGEVVECSPTKNSELFFAVLGGLGQFGIITKARVVLEKAPQRVRWIRTLYTDFAAFSADQERLISAGETFDYVEGFVVKNDGNDITGWGSVPFVRSEIDAAMIPSYAGGVLYCLEVTVAYSVSDLESLHQVVETMLAPLRFHRELLFETDVTYFKFLNRVRETEVNLKAIQEYDVPHACEWKVPHPLLSVFVPASAIAKFDSLVFKRLATSDFTGQVLVYPMNKSKWDSRFSVAIPEDSDEVFYMVLFWSYKTPAEAAARIKMMNQSKIVLQIVEQLGGKQYLPRHENVRQWKRHFGAKWATFVQNKQSFDPTAILAPGQNLFKSGAHFSKYIRMSKN